MYVKMRCFEPCPRPKTQVNNVKMCPCVDTMVIRRNYGISKCKNFFIYKNNNNKVMSWVIKGSMATIKK